MANEFSWNNVGQQGNGEKKEIGYLKFPEGASVIRILDDAPYSRFTHWIPQANQGKGVSIDCIGKNCPICEVIKKEKKEGKTTKSFNSKMTHSINVLVRKLGGQDKNEVMVLEQGNGLFGSIKDQMTMLSNMGFDPDLKNVDLFINRTGKGFNDTKYSVMANPATLKPLTEDEKKLEKYDLKELKPMLDEAQVIMLMNGKSLDEACQLYNDTKEAEDNGFVEAPHVDFNNPY